MKALLKAGIVVVASILLSCDILRAAPFIIVGWTPGEGCFGETDDMSISVTFSEAPDRARTEEAFSLTDNGARVYGTFCWDGVTMKFIPFNPLSRAADFRVSVGTDAMSPGGVSLEEALAGRFSTKAESVRPMVVASVPERAGMLASDLDSVLIEFSEAVDREGYRGCLSISPPQTGVWNLEDGDTKTRFCPLEPWAWATEYSLTVSADIQDARGNRMGRPYTFCFTVGEDINPPHIIEAWGIDASGLRVATLMLQSYDDEAPVLNGSWERTWRLCLRFSEPVSTRSAASRIVVDGGAPLVMKSLEAYEDVLILEFEQPPQWGERLRICLRRGIEDACGNASDDETSIMLLCDGPHSMPPRFVGIRIPLAPGALVLEDRELMVFSVDQPFQTVAITGGDTHYPIGLSTPVSIEVYVELATGASLDLLSIMASFCFSSSNAALDFYPSRVVLEGFTYAQPHVPWEGYAIARLDGSLINRVDSGILTFCLEAGFKDSGGNSTSSSQSVVILK